MNDEQLEWIYTELEKGVDKIIKDCSISELIDFNGLSDISISNCVTMDIDLYNQEVYVQLTKPDDVVFSVLIPALSAAKELQDKFYTLMCNLLKKV